MSVILFSHPRSGSSYYTALLDRYFKQKYKNQSIYLFEFFVIHCTDTFGNAGDVLYNPELYGKPIQVRELQDTAWSPRQLFQKIKIRPEPLEFLSTILQNKTVIFQNADEVQQWYTTECANRLRWLKFLTSIHIHYVVKHFILSEKFSIDKELLEFARATQQAKLYYRQDFYQTLLSHLIKLCYFDLPGAHQQELTHRGYDAHNMQNKMPALEPMAVTLEKDQLLHWIYPFLYFIEFVRDNKFEEADILLYENFLAKQSIVINEKEIKLEILDSNFGQYKEFPMNYAASKDQYFTNSELIKNVVHEKVMELGLLATMQMLGIQLL